MKAPIGKIALMGMCSALLQMSAPRDANAQGGQVFTYPREGQSQEQHELDRRECSQFAIDSTGFDPQFEAQWLARSQAQLHSSVTSPPPDASAGGALRGAAGGAALGAIGGAIGGSAGRGAAIGAATGGLLGAGRRASAQRERVQWEQQQAAQRRHESRQLQAEFDTGMADYERAFSVCMRARNYEVM